MDVRSKHKSELMKPDSKEYEQKRLNELRRSRTIPLEIKVAVNDDMASMTSESDDQDRSMEIGVEITK